VKRLRANDNKLLCSDLPEHGSARWQHSVGIVTSFRVWKGNDSEAISSESLSRVSLLLHSVIVTQCHYCYTVSLLLHSVIVVTHVSLLHTCHYCHTRVWK